MPCTEKRARLLLERGRARIHRYRPFAIQLLDRTVEESVLHPIVVKIDPGSKFTGIAAVRANGTAHHVLLLLELQHRGAAIRKSLLNRRGHRRFRRGRLRYREKRFNNRTRRTGWLPPSLQHRVDTTMSWVTRLSRWLPVTAFAVERNRFDMQLMQKPDITGVGYQNGTLAGTEVREYVLEKFNRTCVYCDERDLPLEIEHIVARSRGGSDRISNLTLSCHDCNQQKNTTPVETFVKDPKRLARILAQAKAPLRDAAAVNATRYALWRSLESTRLPVEASTGGRTKWNRTRFDVPKSHALDAACVGACEAVFGWRQPTITIKATGRGSYQRTRLTEHGFPRGYLTRAKRVRGFATGDMVKAVVPTGKKLGTYIGRVAVRKTGSFNVTTGDGVTIQGINHRHFTMLQKADGYAYLGNQPALKTTRKACSSPS